MFLIHELHVDDFVLEARRDRASYEASRDLVDTLCQIAEARGVRLSIRIRLPFARAALALEGADNALARWEARGHELGTHAHMRAIGRAAAAVSAAGVRRNLCVVPGFIRATRGECARRLRACEHRGFLWSTDQVQDRTFPYGGLVPWRPAPDFSGPGDGPLVFIEPSVNPFDWGMLQREPSGAVRQTHGLRPANFRALLGLLDAHLDLPRPHPVSHFSYVFHEHQHTRGVDTLAVDERSLAAWDDFLAAAAGRPVIACPSEQVYRAFVAAEGEVPAPEGRPRPDLLHDLPDTIQDRLPAAGDLRRRAWRALGVTRRARSRLAWERRRWPARALEALEGGEALEIEVRQGGPPRRVAAIRYGGIEPRAALVVSVSGTFGGRTDTTRLLGVSPGELAARGWVVWVFDRSGTGATRGRATDGGAAGGVSLAPGNPLHAAEAAAVFARAADEGLPAGWLTWSAGVLPALLSLPDTPPPAFLVDAEAPADARSLRPPRPPSRLLGALDLEQGYLRDVDADLPEPWRLLAGLPCVYHRLQARLDHQHGRCALHARVMLDAAPGEAWLNGRPWRGDLQVLPGRMHENGEDVIAILDRILEDLG